MWCRARDVVAGCERAFEPLSQVYATNTRGDGCGGAGSEGKRTVAGLLPALHCGRPLLMAKTSNHDRRGMIGESIDQGGLK